MQIYKNFKVCLSGLCLLFNLILAPPLTSQQASTSEKAMVVAPTPEAVDAGLAILSQGGNAIDAAAASAFALMVADPVMCSLGGRSQILIHLKGGTVVGIDGATQAPGYFFDPAKTGHGYRTCPVPGSPAAIEKMVQEYGKLPLKIVLQPAIQLAQNGFTVNEDLFEALKANEKLLQLYPGTTKHFFRKDGSLYKRGERFVQPALAETLEILADKGSRVFYQGRLAEAIVRDMEANKGLIRARDLEEYQVRRGEVVEGHYRGYTIISRGGTCDGASVVEILQILEEFNLASYAVTDPIYLHILAQALYIGQADEHLPDWQQVAKALALRRIREIDLERALPMPIRPEIKNGETNHLSVIDAEGNAVALTQSIGPSFGSMVVNPELGFFYAYSYDMNDDPVPFQREKTSQSPTFLFKDHKPFLVLGSAGSNRIVSSIVQTVVNVVDHGMTLEEAVSHPRLSLHEGELRLEAFHLPFSALDRLRELGYRVRPYESLNGWFGRVHALLVGPKIYGAADPRDFGAAKGVDQ
jgi:gamma-glutamyltranspeptidase/glutathione hydrolase